MNSAYSLLSFKNASKQFSGTVVVDRVSFDVEGGSILALLGGNGAGKSTLIKMLAGVYTRDGGQILHRGRDVDEPGARSKLAFIHQDLGLIEWMTVAENMAFGYGFGRRGGIIDWRGVRRRAAAALEKVGGGINPELADLRSPAHREVAGRNRPSPGPGCQGAGPGRAHCQPAERRRRAAVRRPAGATLAGRRA